MHDELIKRLRETSIDFGESDHVSVMMLEAADAIEQLTKERDKWMATAKDEREAYWHWFDNYQKDVPCWIPVTERLPETRDYVLCCGAKGGMFVGYVSCFTEPQGFAWAWQHGGQGRKIKWWMPLPQPPESEDN